MTAHLPPILTSIPEGRVSMRCGSCWEYFDVFDPTAQDVTDPVCAKCIEADIDTTFNGLGKSIALHGQIRRVWRRFL